MSDLVDAVRDYLAGRTEPEIVERLTDASWSQPRRDVPAIPHPVSRYLDDALRHSKGHEKQVLKTFMNQRDGLRWFHDYKESELPADFLSNFGAVEIMGPRGLVPNKRLVIGLLAMGPHQHYPPHRHTVDEVYIPLCDGTLWMREGKGFAERATGAMIVHESNEIHAMKTETVPMVALYIWRGGDLSQTPQL